MSYADASLISGSGNATYSVDQNLGTFGRTGSLFAFQQAAIAPDLVCLAKGITGGYLPLAATLTTQKIFDAFLGESSPSHLMTTQAFDAMRNVLNRDGVLVINVAGSLDQNFPRTPALNRMPWFVLKKLIVWFIWMCRRVMIWRAILEIAAACGSSGSS